MSDKKYKEWLKEMEDVSKDDILKFYYNLYFKYEKQQEVLNKIKEYCNKNTLIDRFYNDKIPFEVIVNELNRLLEEIE